MLAQPRRDPRRNHPHFLTRSLMRSQSWCRCPEASGGLWFRSPLWGHIQHTSKTVNHMLGIGITDFLRPAERTETHRVILPAAPGVFERSRMEKSPRRFRGLASQTLSVWGSEGQAARKHQGKTYLIPPPHMALRPCCGVRPSSSSAVKAPLNKPRRPHSNERKKALKDL